MKVLKLIREAAKRAFRAKPVEAIYTWASRAVRISPRSGSKRSGPFSIKGWEWSKFIYEKYKDPRVRKIIVMKPAQVGLSQLVAVLIAWRTIFAPGNGLFVSATESTARKFEEEKLRDLLDNCPDIREQLTGDPDDLKVSYKKFKDSVLALVAATSVSQLSGSTAVYVDCDEVGKWEESKSSEANPFELAEARALEHPHTCKVTAFSTPNDPDHNIHALVQPGTRHRYYTECPHCHGRQDMDFWPKNGKNGIVIPPSCRRADDTWDMDKVKREAYYVCSSGCKVDQSQQAFMRENGDWRQQNPNASEDYVSIEVDGMYTRDWGLMAKRFLELKDKPGGMKDFFTNWLGRPYVPAASSVSEATVRAVILHSKPYMRGKCPNPGALPVCLTMHVDVSQANFWWVILAWYPGEAVALVDWGSAVGLEDVMEIANKDYPIMTADGKGLMEETITVYQGSIDSGYDARQGISVYDFVLGLGAGRFNAMQGRDPKAHRMFQPVRLTKISHKGREFILTQFSDSYFKMDLYIRRIKERQGPAFWMPQDTTRDMILQLTNERLVDKNGEMVWERLGDQHWGDAIKMGLVAGSMMAEHLGEPAAETPEPEPPKGE